MNSVIPLIILFSASYLGYRIFEAIHFPASRIVGPIFVVALIQLLGFSVVVPNIFKMIFSIIFGTYLGLRFDKIAQKQLLKSIIPAMFLSVTYIFITILYGNLLNSVSSLDQNTSFLSVIPGGVAEAGVLSVSFNANLAQVSAFQLIRFLSIVLIMPIISKIIILPLVKGKSKTLSKQNPHQKIEEKTPDKIKSSNRQITYSSLWLFIIGTIGSMFFYKIHFPAALLLGATFFIALLQTFSPYEFNRPNARYYEWAQIGMGALIGTSFTKESFVEMSTLVYPMVLLTFFIITTSLFLGFAFSKIFKMDYMTGLMSVLPGGLSTMIILAEDLEADVVTISTLQLSRLITAVAFIPIIYQWLL